MQKLKDFFKKIDKKEWLIVFLLFLFALAVRGHLMRYELVWEFDTYYHARMTGEIIKNLAIPTNDPLAYYFLDSSPVAKSGIFFWAFNAAIYKIFTFGAPYNKELLLFFVKFLPALYGALICAGMYFFGKEMYGKKAGIVMAFFAAVVPAFVYRTMAGQYEEDALGFLWLIIGFIFFVRAIKPLEFNKETVKNAVLSGIFFGIMAFTWEMFLIIPLIMIGYFTWTLVLFWFKNSSKEKMVNFVKVFAVSFLVFSSLAILFTGTLWINRTVDYVVNYIPISQENIDRPTAHGSDNVLAVTVGEENTGRQFFGEKYNAMVVFVLLALILIPIRLFSKKRWDHLSLLIFFWILLTLFMAWNKLKFTFTLGLPLAAGAGVVFTEIFYFLENRSHFEKKVVGLALAFMLLVGAGAASIFMVTKLPPIEEDNGWKPALEWVRQNTPQDAKMFNWWDHGHWIAFFGERATLTDNRNISGEANTAYAQFVLSENEQDAFKIVKEFGATHVVSDYSMLGNLNTMGFYAYNITDYSDQRVAKYFGVFFDCIEQTNTASNEKTYVCGPNTLTESQMNSIPSRWIQEPNQLIDKQVPGFVYRLPDNSAMFILNVHTNNSMLAKLWFNQSGLTHFENIHTDKHVKIFRIID